MNRTTVILALLLLSSSGVAAGASEQNGVGMYLYRTTVHQGNLENFNPGQRLVLDLQTDDPEALAAAFAATSVQILSSTAHSVRVRVTGAETFQQQPGREHTRATWVVDHDQPQVAQLADALWQQGRPDLEQIRWHASEAIPTKNYRNGFLIASQVVNMGEGDCTEHAVLTAAMARSAGYPARIVMGFMLAVVDSELHALGHAWTEIHDGEQWQIADATRYGTEVDYSTAYYLPWSTLSNEGPGFALSMFEFGALRPLSVTVVAASGATQ